MNNNYSSKLLVMAFVMFFAFQVAMAQQSFTVSPSNTVSKTIYTEQNTDLTIYFENITQDSIYLEYTNVSNTMDSSWTLLFCDYQVCVPYVPATRVMDPIPPGVSGFVKLTINPHTNLSTGSCVFDVWDQAFPSDKVTVTLTAESIVGIEDNPLWQNVQVYPNPATDKFYLSTGNITVEKAALYDVNGMKVKELNGLSGISQVRTDDLSAGLYFLHLKSGEAVLTKKILKTN